MKITVIKCKCGGLIDIANSPEKVVCQKCGLEYGKQPPKLKFMGVEEAPLMGVVIQ